MDSLSDKKNPTSSANNQKSSGQQRTRANSDLFGEHSEVSIEDLTVMKLMEEIMELD